MPENDWQRRDRDRESIDRWNPRDDYYDDDQWNELPQRHPRDPVYFPREPVYRPERDPREPDFLPPRDNRQPIYQPVGRDDDRRNQNRPSANRRDDDWDLRRDPRESDFFDSPSDNSRDPNFRMPSREEFPVRSPRL